MLWGRGRGRGVCGRGRGRGGGGSRGRGCGGGRDVCESMGGPNTHLDAILLHSVDDARRPVRQHGLANILGLTTKRNHDASHVLALEDLGVQASA